MPGRVTGGKMSVVSDKIDWAYRMDIYVVVNKKIHWTINAMLERAVNELTLDWSACDEPDRLIQAMAKGAVYEAVKEAGND